jgi:hypothetical protein
MAHLQKFCEDSTDGASIFAANLEMAGKLMKEPTSADGCKRPEEG